MPWYRGWGVRSRLAQTGHLLERLVLRPVEPVPVADYKPISLDIGAAAWSIAENQREGCEFSEITIVTAFFDIGRGSWKSKGFSRSTDTYFEHFERLAKLRNPMVIFCEEHHVSRIGDIRRSMGLSGATSVVSIPDLFTLSNIASAEREVGARMSRRYRAWVNSPNAPEYNKPRYNVLMALKPKLVELAVELGLCQTSHTAWVDFGYCRDDETLPESHTWRWPFDHKINLFRIADPHPLRRPADLARTGDVVFVGAPIVGPTESWKSFSASMVDSFNDLLRRGLADEDQTLIYLSWSRHPDGYTSHYINPSNWFVVLRNFSEDCR